jgi:GDSL-like Lipase/Acylhydrolase family
MDHVILLGDSIFDNAAYVPDRPAVIDQLRQALPKGWRATLLAVDGSVIDDVARQLGNVPADATHLVISVGGNDALGTASILSEPASTVGDALQILQDERDQFRKSYRAMLRAVSDMGKPTCICTIYDAVPGLGPAEKAALAGFNELILREAIAAGIPVIDLRVVCERPGDYSHVSPIEPSMVGGGKITRAIAAMASLHDFTQRRSTVYT